MAGLKTIASALESKLRAAGIEKYVLTVSDSEKRELNTEHTDFNLLRTIFSHNAGVTAFIGGKKGSASGNDLTDAGLQKLVDDAVAGAQSSPDDDANDIAEKQKNELFRQGSLEPDMDRFYERLQELLQTVEKEFPKIRIMQLIASHSCSHSIYRNSNGTEFESYAGFYDATLEFAAQDGEKTTGLAYSGVVMKDLSKPILALGSLKQVLADTERSLTTVSIADKFTGPIILTPDALAYFADELIYNFLSGSVVMDGTSRWLDKLGEKVASDKLTLRFQTEGEPLVTAEYYTGDGYRSENVTAIEKGELKTFLLSLYAAKKTGRPVTKNSGSGMIIEAGDTPLSEMVQSMKRGLIVGGFSGGQPGTNGEFSGVAKNSFYVEDGTIRGAVMETMISGNLADLFSNVVALSDTLISDGSTAFPYMMADGVTISGN